MSPNRSSQVWSLRVYQQLPGSATEPAKWGGQLQTHGLSPRCFHAASRGGRGRFFLQNQTVVEWSRFRFGPVLHVVVIKALLAALLLILLDEKVFLATTVEESLAVEVSHHGTTNLLVVSRLPKKGNSLTTKNTAHS